jgi:hypothetical protein
MPAHPFRPAAGRHRGRKHAPGPVRRSAPGLVLAAAASLLPGAGIAQAAMPPSARALDDGPDLLKEPGGRQTTGFLVIDNSSADSWLEIDRTLNTLVGSKGTAGSDHDGGGGAVEMTARDVSGAEPAELGHPRWQSDDDD